MSTEDRSVLSEIMEDLGYLVTAIVLVGVFVWHLQEHRHQHGIEEKMDNLVASVNRDIDCLETQDKIFARSVNDIFDLRKHDSDDFIRLQGDFVRMQTELKEVGRRIKELESKQVQPKNDMFWWNDMITVTNVNPVYTNGYYFWSVTGMVNCTK